MSTLVLIALAAGCRTPASRHPGSEVRTISIVIAPQSLDPAIEDVRLTNGNAGRHYACFPATAERWNGLTLLYIIGTDDDPSETYELAEYACGLGFAAIAPMYKTPWRPPDVCQDDAACYERVRREIIEGEDLAPDPISVDAANSLWHRIDTLVEHLAARAPRIWQPIRDRVIRRDLTRVVLAGFSQGSGHVPLIAHDFEVARVIMSGSSSRDATRFETAKSDPAWSR